MEVIALFLVNVVLPLAFFLSFFFIKTLIKVSVVLAVLLIFRTELTDPITTALYCFMPFYIITEGLHWLENHLNQLTIEVENKIEETDDERHVAPLIIIELLTVGAAIFAVLSI